MIVLDTNVLSELMKTRPDCRVVAWLRRQPGASLYTTSITQAEILYGLALLPSGKRRQELESAVNEMFELEFQGRVLSFGSGAAAMFAELAAARRLAGQPISHFDAQIAAITRISAARLATRNVSDFTGCGLEIVNPWM
jgi:predicted nucleic acid-binding protein